jgi:hypothetical protein
MFARLAVWCGASFLAPPNLVYNVDFNIEMMKDFETHYQGLLGFRSCNVCIVSYIFKGGLH